MTPNQRRPGRRRSVGWLDDGRKAFVVRRGDTPEMVRAIFDTFDPELELTGQEIVEWCCHTADYAYRHDCADWCDNPSTRIVWTARYPASLRDEETAK